MSEESWESSRNEPARGGRAAETIPNSWHVMGCGENFYFRTAIRTLCQTNNLYAIVRR